MVNHLTIIEALLAESESGLRYGFVARSTGEIIAQAGNKDALSLHGLVDLSNHPESIISHYDECENLAQSDPNGPPRGYAHGRVSAVIGIPYPEVLLVLVGLMPETVFDELTTESMRVAWHWAYRRRIWPDVEAAYSAAACGSTWPGSPTRTSHDPPGCLMHDSDFAIPDFARSDQRAVFRIAGDDCPRGLETVLPRLSLALRARAGESERAGLSKKKRYIRNPRMDPRRGDVLEHQENGERRAVIATLPEDSNVRYRDGSMVCECSAFEWREWAKQTSIAGLADYGHRDGERRSEPWRHQPEVFLGAAARKVS